MSDELRFAEGPPPEAQCPYCGVPLTEENMIPRLEGEAPTIFASENVPVYVLQCVKCLETNAHASRGSHDG